MARGTIINRGTKEQPNYSVVIEGTRDPVTGKRRQHWHPGYKLKKEAEQAKTRLLQEIDTGRYVEQSKLNIRVFMDEWLLAIEGTVRHSTWQNYKANVELHVIPDIGGIKVQRLTPANLNALYKKLQAEGKKEPGRKKAVKKDDQPGNGDEKNEKKGLSAKTVRNIHVIIHKALDYAVAHNLVQKNVASLATPPKPARFGENEMKTWEAGELKQFLAAIESNRYYPAYLLAATTGMRRGEVLGLRWEDVDLDRGELSIRQALTSVSYKLQFSQPKTPRSRRCIPLDKWTVAVLKTQKARQAAERLAKGSEYITTGLVFSKEDGSTVHPDQFSHLFNALVKKTQLPRIRLHDVRHTYATLALQHGVHVKVVSERLGHSSVAFTLDVYAHVIPAMKQEAADAVAALVFES